MVQFGAGPMMTVGGKVSEDEFVIEMHTDRGTSNGFSKNLLNTYFQGKLTTAKINNIVRKFGGYVDASKDKWSTSYIYFFKDIETAKKAADAINAVALAKIL